MLQRHFLRKWVIQILIYPGSEKNRNLRLWYLICYWCRYASVVERKDLPPSHVKKSRMEAMLQRTKKAEQVIFYMLRTCMNEAISGLQSQPGRGTCTWEAGLRPLAVVVILSLSAHMNMRLSSRQCPHLKISLTVSGSTLLFVFSLDWFK